MILNEGMLMRALDMGVVYEKVHIFTPQHDNRVRLACPALVIDKSTNEQRRGPM
jgi:hypothetical protein